MKTVLKLADMGGDLIADNDESEALFSHLDEDYSYKRMTVKYDFERIKFLAKAHGWEVQLRKLSRKEVEERMDPGDC